MEQKPELQNILNEYLESFSSEKDNLKLINDFVANHDGQQLYDRKNFKGHLTASAFIISHDRKSILLLKHKSLNRWLQPGGHIDREDESLFFSAKREVFEETGIPLKDLEPLYKGVFDFDSHVIPENTLKKELAHYHHDVRFLFQHKKKSSVVIEHEESTAFNWLSFSELSDYNDFARVLIKIQNIIV